MAEEEPKKKGILAEFKEFITRGNVIDLAVGVIIGGAFTAIVNALTGQILQPLINWVFSLTGAKDGLASAITMLSPSYTEAGDLDLASSIYINWGAFLSAVINFLLTALVLFFVVKGINALRKVADDAKEKAALLKKKEGEEVVEEEKKEE